MIEETIEKLLAYSTYHLGMGPENVTYLRNYLMEQFGVTMPYDGKIDVEAIQKMDVPDSLVEEMEAHFVSQGLEPKEAERRTVMVLGTLTPLPSQVIAKFRSLYKENPVKATDYLYYVSIKNDYVRKSKIAQNIVWLASFPGYALEVTINLTKPEKDNKDIRAASKVVSDAAYPECVLCIQNEGCYGRGKTPPRGNLRLIPLKLNGENWYLQYSPYGYYHEHCIVIYEKHVPMKVCRNNLSAQIDFVEQFPHYFLGSNSDLPIVGGSILSHEHFQGGRHIMPMMKATIRESLGSKRYPGLSFSTLNWPSAAFLMESESKKDIIDAACRFFDTWKEYDDPSVNIIHKTTEQHNTATTIAEYKDGKFRLYILPRNNRTNDEFPDGIFHVRPSLHFIKKEGIGLIEAMGLFILPPRLKREMKLSEDILKDPSIKDKVLADNPDMVQFLPMIDDISSGKHSSPAVFISVACRHILEDISVFKDDEAGQLALKRFVEALDL